MKLLPSILFICSLLSVSAHAAPTTIFSDNFNRTGPLSGTVPTYSSIGGTWTGPIGGYTTSPSAAITNPLVNTAHSFTTPTLLLNTTYTLSVFMGNQTGLTSTAWLAFGFGPSLPLGDGLLLEGTGKSYIYENGLGAYIPNASSNFDNFTITLTTGNSLANSSIVYSRGGTGVMDTPHAVNANSFGSSIYLQDSLGTQGFYGNLLLTATPVPETSSALLGLVGVLGLVIRRRRSA
jgi:MYXO-CTERM domain-containing protein